MPYTLWSCGRLLGETELEYARHSPLTRGGGFWPTVIGSRLMPVVTGVSSASIVLAKKSRDLTADDGARPVSGAEFEMRLHELTEYADYVEAIDRLNALDLELHDPDGNLVPTEWLDIRDTNYLSHLEQRDLEDDWEDEILAEDFDPQLEEDIRHDLHVLGIEFDPLNSAPFVPREDAEDDGCARRPFPLYQLLVRLLEESAIP